MIKYNAKTINDWYYDTSNLVKIYKGGALCYYKVSGTPPSPTSQTPCFAVVDDISQYSDTEFEDVFNNADGKWYKLNNLSQYEEYGIYGSGRTITTYEGKLTIDGDYEYIYSGNSWVNLGEISGGTATLPNKSFVLNYNAKNYDATTNSIPYTSGQSKAVNATQDYGTNTIVDHSSDGYISVTANTRLVISGGTTPMYRTNTETGCTMTIVSKVRTTNNYSILTCRGSAGINQMNWMWRYPIDGIFLHGSTSFSSPRYYTSTTANPITASVRVIWNASVQQQINDWTNDGSYYGAFQYGSYSNDVNSNGALFCDYITNDDEFWQGDFYWVYMSQEVLTDEEIQQVIAYNEGGGGTPIYPMYYSEMQDPPNNVSFSSMTEAESYECPWWGMSAEIDNVDYMFCETNTWLTKYTYVEVSGDYLCDNGNKYKKMQEYDRNVDGSTSATTNYVIGDLIESGSTDCQDQRLPIGYTEVEYIENTYMAYIDSGFKTNQDSRVVCTMQTVTSNKNASFVGAGSWEKVNGMRFDYESGSLGTLHISWGNNNTWSVYSSCVGDYNKHEYDWDKNYFYRDKGTVNEFSASTTYSNFQCTDNLGIFTVIEACCPADQYSYVKGKLYSCQIYDNGTLVRDFVPCIDPNNVVGVYDIVNDVFYGSANGNSFIAGSPI